MEYSRSLRVDSGDLKDDRDSRRCHVTSIHPLLLLPLPECFVSVELDMHFPMRSGETQMGHMESTVFNKCLRYIASVFDLL